MRRDMNTKAAVQAAQGNYVAAAVSEVFNALKHLTISWIYDWIGKGKAKFVKIRPEVYKLWSVKDMYW